MATYEQVRTFVKDKYSKTMQNYWIAHAKEINNLPIKIAHNRKSSAQSVVAKFNWPLTCTFLTHLGAFSR